MDLRGGFAKVSAVAKSGEPSLIPSRAWEKSPPVASPPRARHVTYSPSVIDRSARHGGHGDDEEIASTALEEDSFLMSLDRATSESHGGTDRYERSQPRGPYGEYDESSALSNSEASGASLPPRVSRTKGTAPPTVSAYGKPTAHRPDIDAWRTEHEAASQSVQQRQEELLLYEAVLAKREQAHVKREAEVNRREAVLKSKEQQCAAVEEYRKKLQEVSKQLTRREWEVEEASKALHSERQRFCARVSNLDAREKELELEQEKLMTDSRRNADLIKERQRQLDERMAACSALEEELKQRSCELDLRNETLVSWERRLRREQHELDKRSTKVQQQMVQCDEKVKKAEEVLMRENALNDREAMLWIEASRAVPESITCAAALQSSLKELHSKLTAMKE